jgi:hypothetical protein
MILQQTIASLFKRKGSESINQKALELLVSMELRWFDPTEAKKIIEYSKKTGLLTENSDGLKPNFDVSSIQIPIGFRPPKDLMNELEQDQDSIFMQIVNQICLSTGMDETEVIADINSKQAQMEGYVTLEVIAILYAKQHEVDVDKFTEQVKNKLLES